jgi:hypothetical protein
MRLQPCSPVRGGRVVLPRHDATVAGCCQHQVRRGGDVEQLNLCRASKQMRQVLTFSSPCVSGGQRANRLFAVCLLAHARREAVGDSK